MLTIRSRRAGAAAAALLVLNGCGGEPAPAAAPTAMAPSNAAAPTSATAEPSQTAKPSESDDPDAPLSFGEAATVGDKIATATVYAYRQPVAAAAPRPAGQPGFTWAAADVKVCALKGTGYEGISVSSDRWKLVYSDDTEMNPSTISYHQFPMPEYPYSERNVAAGRCVRGWVIFPAPAEKKPAYVEYVPQDVLGARWTVQ